LLATHSGGALEVALSRLDGAAGCVYAPVGAVGSVWAKVGCWPETSTTGPWTQIEVRVRSANPGAGTLVVSALELR
jgi:hypothetical protein